MGEVPRWYRIVKAAQYLGSTPWELETQPWRYVLQAEEARAAELSAQTAQQNQQSRMLNGSG